MVYLFLAADVGIGDTFEGYMFQLVSEWVYNSVSVSVWQTECSQYHQGEPKL